MGPHRLVVRTSRRGRDNPGSTPGVDILNMTHEYPGRLTRNLGIIMLSWWVGLLLPPFVAPWIADNLKRLARSFGVLLILEHS